jgi:hypothetical protein
VRQLLLRHLETQCLHAPEQQLVEPPARGSSGCTIRGRSACTRLSSGCWQLQHLAAAELRLLFH